MRLPLARRGSARRKELQRLEREGLDLRSQDPTRALDCFKTVLSREPDRVVSLRAAGRLLMKARRHAEAEPYWDKLSRVARDDPEPMVQLARIHRQAGREDQAAQLTAAALRLSPHYAAAQEMRERLAAKTDIDWGAPDAEGHAPAPSAQRSEPQPLHRLFAAMGFGRAGRRPPAPTARRSPTEILFARARRLAQRGDQERLAATLEELLGAAGPTPEVLEFIATHRASLGPQPPLWLEAALDHEESGASDRARRLVDRARRLARRPDAKGFLATVDLLFDLTGPTDALTALVNENAALVAESGDRRLIALLDAVGGPAGRSAERLFDRARRQARTADADGLRATMDLLFDLTGPTDSLTSLAKDNAALIAHTGDRRLMALLETDAAGSTPSARLIERARRAAKADDLEAFGQALDLLFDLTGPTEALTDLAKQNAALIARAGDRRLTALLEADGAASAPSQRLIERARRAAKADELETFRGALDLLFDLTGPTEALIDLAKQNAALVARTGDRRLMALLETDAATAGPSERLVERARRAATADDLEAFREALDLLFDLTGPTGALTVLAKQNAALIARTGDRRLMALLETGGAASGPAERLAARARRAAMVDDLDRFREAMDLLFDLTGPGQQLTALARENAALVRRSGDGRLTALLDSAGAASPGAAAQRLIARARRQARDEDLDGFRATLDLLFDLTGPAPALVDLAKRNASLVERTGDRRLMALLDVAGAGRGRLGKVRSVAAITDPRVDLILPRLTQAVQDGDPGLAARLLGRLSRLEFSDERVRGVVADHAGDVLTALESRRARLSARNLSAIEQRLARVYAADAWLIQALARQRELDGSAAAGLRLYEHLVDSAAGAGPALLHAATLACELSDWDAASAYARRATLAASQDRRLLTSIAALLIHHDRAREAADCWRIVDARGTQRMWVKQGLIRALDAAQDHESLVEEVHQLLRDAPALIDLPAVDQNYLIDIVRRLVQAISRVRGDRGLPDIAATLVAKEPPSALREWILASLDLARPDYLSALRRLDEGVAATPLQDGVALDLHAEKALIYQRYHLFGGALAELERADPRTLQLSSHYTRRFDLIQQVSDLCGNASEALLYPEALFDILMEEIAISPIGYAPRPRHVAMVSGSLGQGGGERQTITVVRRILKDSRVARLSLLVRSTHLRPTDDFFLSSVAELPIDLSIYGKDWLDRTDIAALLPELVSRPRLLAALDLLPHNAREEISRLCRLFLDRRPQAVHIWQDIPHAAIACALAGVPHFFVHRGSLAPDYWEQTEHQTAVHFRPMRHVYRRLLERPDFVLLNNSISGCKTDQTWVDWPDPAPFQVVYNAVDFSQLGPHTGRNFALRRELGIADDAPVIGASFRIAAVKRPLYWIEAARQIREAIPNAHFLIIGDGEMTDDVASFAAAHGFAEAVHLPGRVSNVGDWYRAMDVKLMTSEREGIPNAIIEAQHFGVPIVATHVGGIHEAIDIGETGFVVPRDDGPSPYADQVIALLRDTVWHEAARQKAPEFVHHKFSLDTVLDNLVRYYGIEGVEATA